ncbi:hypothetical protein T484DRAFT_1904493 [Baffinella frigidus]|nr:hypothetical protein T484DRAFT_1904493 [Cryptophyta sp. CCMP2293]
MQEIQGPTDLPNAHWEGGGGVAGGGGPGGGYGVAGYGLVLCEARWYGDGQFYQALRGPRTSGGGHLVTFTGHEEDKPQDTAAVDVRLCQVPESRSTWSPSNSPGDFPPQTSHQQPQPPPGLAPPPMPMGMFNGIPGFPLPDAPVGVPPPGYTQEGGSLPGGMFPGGGAPLSGGAGGGAGFPPPLPGWPPGGDARGGSGGGGAEGGGFLGMGGNISVEDLFRMIGKGAIVGGEIPRGASSHL